MPIKYLRVNPDHRDVTERINTLYKHVMDYKTAGVSVLEYGAKGDGVTDDTEAIQAAINSGYYDIFFPAGTYITSSTITVPIRVNLRGVGFYSIIRPSSTGSFTNNYMFICNYNTGTSTWTAAYPNIQSGRFHNLHFNNVSDADNYSGAFNVNGINGVYCAGSYEFDNCRWLGFTIGVESSGLYDDNFKMSHCHFTRPNIINTTTDWQIIVGYLGDGVTIDATLTVIGDTNKEAQRNGLWINGCNGAVINGYIGHGIKVTDSTAIVFNGTHLEAAHVYINNSSVMLNSAMLYRDWTYPPLELANGTENGRTVVLNNVEFVTWAYRGTTAHPNPKDVTEYDIKLHGTYSVEINHCYRRYIDAYISRSSVTGIKVLKSDNTAFTEWNDFSYLNSVRSVIGYGEADYNKKSVYVGEDFFAGSISNSSGGTTIWQIASGTYYYNYILLWDTSRMIGEGSPVETSRALTNGSSGVILLPTFGTKNKNCIVRLYRGTSAGSYDKYVDVHSIANWYLIDDGETVNGYKWQTRVAAGVDTTYEKVVSFDRTQDILHGIIRSDQAPYSANTPFVAGDRFDLITHTAGKYIGYVCTVSGSPGTWAKTGIINLEGQLSWNPGSIAVGASTSNTVTVTGAAFSDWPIISSTVDLLGLTVTAYVSAANTITIVLANLTAGAVDVPSATFYAKVIKR